MLTALPVTLLALVVAGAPWNQPAPEGVRATLSPLHAVLSEPSAWRLPEPEILRTHLLKPNASGARVGPHRVGRQSVATKIGAGFVGALLGFYVGATVGDALDREPDNEFGGGMTGGFIGAAAGAIAGVLMAR
jgi:hypothetical protein